MRVHPGRVRAAAPERGIAAQGPGIYWMSRDQRADDNWALLHAQELALAGRRPLVAVFCLDKTYPGANARHYDFMLRGLAVTEKELRAKNIPLVLLCGHPPEELAAFAKARKAAFVTTDFDPLRHKRAWLAAAAARLDIPFFEVDAHNLVPCRAASDKREFAARTIRPKIHRLLQEYLEPFPELLPHPFAAEDFPQVDWDAAGRFPEAADAPGPAGWIAPGPAAALEALGDFIENRLPGYAAARNDPTLDGQSNLSPYLHFGQISAQRIALAVMAAKAAASGDREAFFEELVVRRELSDNFCLHEPDYDRISGGPAWGLAELFAHRGDRRPFVYDLAAFEAAATHSALWNAAQTEMTRAGKMHGYMRMFWAKKILEWSKSPEDAFEIARVLNDKYELDGRDPNGFTGIHWSLTGLHDRPWKSRPVYGKIRYMNERGCRRKFDVEAYIRRWSA